MAYPTPKELKRLADACRKAGVKSFKSGDLEFTLSEEAPVSSYKRAKKQAQPETSQSSEIDTEQLSPDALLFWSVGAGSPFIQESGDV